MNKKIIKLDDSMAQEDKVLLSNITSSSPIGSRVIIKDGTTGEIRYEGHNKTVVAGSQYMATKLWGIDNRLTFPNYNDELGLENSVMSKTPDNDQIIQLYCVGINGCGQENSQVYPVTYTTRMPPTSIVPFRYEKKYDIEDDLRDIYFGRKVDELRNRYIYYFKKIENKQLHIEYIDGTEITSSVYNNPTDTRAITYVESSLKITKTDCRDIFSSGDFRPLLSDGSISPPLDLGDARINSLSLLSAWYKTDKDTGFKYFMNVLPVTEIHFSNQWLTDATLTLDIIYQVFY